MKGLKKVALASAIAAVSVGAQAELKALDDATLGETTGQAGLTIDLETKWTIGEFMYKDAISAEDKAGGATSTNGGALLITGISLGGNTAEDFGGATGLVAEASVSSTYLDNARLNIDVAAAGEQLDYGMSEVIGLAKIVAAVGNTDVDILTATGGVTGVAQDKNGLVIDTEKTYGDGDLVIHEGFTDPFQKLDSGSGLGGFAANVASGNLAAVDYDTLLAAGTRAVDFNFAIDGLGLASSAYTAGSQADPLGWDTATGVDSDTTTTRLLSAIDIRGYLGPVDIHIENQGNGFDGTGDLALLGIDTNSGNADSIINWDRYFRITDLDIFIDIAGVQLKQVQINNTRGDLTGLNTGVDASGNTVNTTALGFAHSLRQIYAVRNNVLNLEAFGAAALGGTTGPALIAAAYVDGVAINTAFKGDIDIGHLSFGDTDDSIGQIFLTDVTSYTNWTISAH